MQQLHPRAVWLFFIRGVSAAFGAVLFLFILFVIALDEGVPNIFFGLANWTQGLGVPLTVALFLALWVIGAFVWAKLSRHFYKYELTDDGFRKELGVIWKKYTTIPYDRIQNVDINRGIIARLLGLSDILIQTAGSSAVYSRYGSRGLGAEGVLPGLSKEDAERVRDELIRRAKGSKNQGL